MTNNIGGISGYGYGIGNFYTGNNNRGNNIEPPVDENPGSTEQANNNVNVDPNEVLNFLASSSITINNAPKVTAGNDGAVADRVDGYVQNFEMIFSIIAQEFGNKVAEQLMNDDDFIDALMNAA